MLHLMHNLDETIFRHKGQIDLCFLIYYVKQHKYSEFLCFFLHSMVLLHSIPLKTAQSTWPITITPSIADVSL